VFRWIESISLGSNDDSRVDCMFLCGSCSFCESADYDRVSEQTNL
jgi:hypothetical protein